MEWKVAYGSMSMVFTLQRDYKVFIDQAKFSEPLKKSLGGLKNERDHLEIWGHIIKENCKRWKFKKTLSFWRYKELNYHGSDGWQVSFIRGGEEGRRRVKLDDKQIRSRLCPW